MSKIEIMQCDDKLTCTNYHTTWMSDCCKKDVMMKTTCNKKLITHEKYLDLSLIKRSTSVRFPQVCVICKEICTPVPTHRKSRLL